jgi:hypothetical protein
LQVGYDDTFIDHLGARNQAENYIATVWVHVQAYFCHHSLRTKILIERLPGIKHYEGIDLADKNLNKMKVHTKNDLSGADLMLYFGVGCKNCANGGGKSKALKREVGPNILLLANCL